MVFVIRWPDSSQNICQIRNFLKAVFLIKVNFEFQSLQKKTVLLVVSSGIWFWTFIKHSYKRKILFPLFLVISVRPVNHPLPSFEGKMSNNFWSRGQHRKPRMIYSKILRRNHKQLGGFRYLVCFCFKNMSVNWVVGLKILW